MRAFWFHALARVVLLEARAGVDDQQRAHPLGMPAVEGERHVAAERQPADDGLFRAGLIQQRGDVGDRVLLAVGRLIRRVVALAVAAHVPQDQRVLLRQRLDLALPHLRRRRIAVGQDQRRAGAVHLVVDVDPVAVEFRHRSLPLLVFSLIESRILAGPRRATASRPGTGLPAMRECRGPERCPPD